LFVVHAERTTKGSMNINLFIGLFIITIFRFWRGEINNIYLIASEYPNLYVCLIIFPNFGPSNIEPLVK
jgi:hypothetical protein